MYTIDHDLIAMTEQIAGNTLVNDVMQIKQLGDSRFRFLQMGGDQILDL